MQTKVCARCRVPKLLEAFSKKKRLKYGRSSECRQCDAARWQVYRVKNAAYLRERWTRNNKRFAEQGKSWRLRNAARLRQLSHLNYLKTKAEKHAKRMLRFHLHPELAYFQTVRRRILKYGTAFVEHVSLDVVYKRDKALCSLCHKHVKRREATVDHIVPLTRGGEHSYKNSALAHRSCNCRKYNNVAVQQMRLF